jgi:hypothetical protein
MMTKKHRTCESHQTHIQYDRLQNFGLAPALVCSECEDKYGRPKWISWLSQKDMDQLTEMGLFDTQEYNKQVDILLKKLFPAK